MSRFRVIVTGTGMNIPPDGYTGFATTRFVHSKSEKEAAEKALAIVSAAVTEEPMFVASPKPVLAVDTVARVRNPFKRSRPSRGYSFIGADASLEDVLRLERQVGTGCF